MTKTEYRKRINELLAEPDLALADKVAMMEQCCVDFLKNEEGVAENKGKPWSDEELRIVLLHSPTAANCVRLARAFKRSFGSIELIFRWAATADADALDKRGDDKFIMQIKKVAKEIGWRATG